MIRYGIIGCGSMGREHIENLFALGGGDGGVQVTALADPHPASLQTSLLACAQALRPAPQAFTGHRELLASGLCDAVVIATPNHTHAALLRDALALPALHILVEKPLVTRIEDGVDLLQRDQGRSGIVWVGQEYRYMPPAAAFIDAVHGGRVGRLQMVSIREHRFPFLVKVGDWNRFAANTGGTMVEKCCHFFDLMRLITQSEAVRVYCSGAMDVNHLDEVYDGRTPDIIDNSYTTVDFANGTRAMLDLSMFADGAEQQEEITAVGSEARLECLIPAGDLIFSPRTGFLQPKAPERTHVSVDETALKSGSHHGSTYYEHQKFYSAVVGNGRVEVSAKDGLMAVAIGTAAEISAREHRVVTMDELGF